ncbi:MAG: PIG-L deacetylase family protein [Chloroflexota bacterium]
MADIESRTLVVSPHPDDSEFGCAGTVAKWVAEGREVVYVVCTNGDKGSNDPDMTSERLAIIREQEEREAARTLGVKEVILLRHPDGELEDNRTFREEMVRVIRTYRPDLIIVPDPYRRPFQHRDHRITGIVTIDAAFPYARDHLHFPEHKSLGLSPHKVREIYLSGTDSPEVYVDIGETIEKKMAALRCHRSQFSQERMAMLDKIIRERAANMGRCTGVAFAEGFRHIQFPP